MIKIKSFGKFSKYLREQGVDIKLPVSDLLSSQETLDQDPDLEVWFDQQGIRSAVINTQKQIVLTFQDDSLEALFVLNHLNDITNQETQWGEDTLGIDIADMFKKMLEQESDIAMRKYVDGDFTRPMDYDRLIRQEQEGRGFGNPHIPKINFPKSDFPWED